MRNTLYLILTSGLQASLGFIFWVVAARLFTSDETGRASSLISATVFIALIAMLGLNTSFIRYLPGVKDRDTLITGGLAVVTISGLVLGALYVVAIPAIAPRLAFVEHRPLFAIGFVVLTAAATVNLLTDSVFIGSHKAGYIALTDGAIAGAVKIAGLILLAGAGAFGLYSASSVGLAATAVVSVLLIGVRLHWRPKFRGSLTSLLALARFSGANYATSFLALIPQTVLPIIILDHLGPSSAAYYYVAYQVASLAYSTVYAVQAPMLAEGSRGDVDLKHLAERSARLMLIVSLPVVLVFVLAGRWILLIFGSSYSAHGTLALIVLAASTVPMAAINLIETVLRLLGRLKVIVWSTVLYAVSVCILAWLLAPHGIAAVAAAWPISVSLAAVPCALSLLRARPVTARHRRGDRIDVAVGSSFRAAAGVAADRNFAEVQQAGLAALLSLAAAGNTAPIAFGVAAFDRSPERLDARRQGLSGQRNASEMPHRHRSSRLESSHKPKRTSSPEARR